MKLEGSRFCLAVQLLLALKQITLNNGVNHALTARNLDLPRLGDFIMNTNTHTLLVHQQIGKKLTTRHSRQEYVGHF